MPAPVGRLAQEVLGGPRVKLESPDRLDILATTDRRAYQGRRVTSVREERRREAWKVRAVLLGRRESRGARDRKAKGGIQGQKDIPAREAKQAWAAKPVRRARTRSGCLRPSVA